MKYWTIQSQKVMQILEKEKIYYPKFALSQYYEQYHELYDFMLKSFNDNNNFACEGLIYAFCVSVKDMIFPIQNINDFKYFIKKNRSKITYLWKYFLDNNCKILELEIDLSFNDLSLSFNDFQYIMPSEYNKLLFDPNEYRYNCGLILSNIRKGQIMSSGEEDDLVQAHLPYIKESNVVNIYELFTLDSI